MIKVVHLPWKLLIMRNPLKITYGKISELIKIRAGEVCNAGGAAGI
ncbi:hypothetical protein [Palaeococcus pacificus]|nr:hypothetical protein [Palaeococcus pacificus]